MALTEAEQKRLEELIKRVPAEFRPLAEKYGETMVRMAEDEVDTWIDLVTSGQKRKAYRAAFEAMEPEAKLAAMMETNAALKAAGQRSKSIDTIQEQIGAEFLQACLVLFRAWLLGV